jgi:hypothetical protein
VERLEHLGYNDLAEELSGQREGDIIMSDAQFEEMETFRRTGQRDLKYRWDDSTIPYKIETSYFSKFLICFQFYLIICLKN